jgi:hypothetical protein
VAAAGYRGTSSETRLTTQREALRALGLRGTRPPLTLARTDPSGYLAALRQASEEAELTDPGGLGGFIWLLQAVRVPLPASLGPVLADAVLADQPVLADAVLADAVLADQDAAPVELRVHG